MIEEIVGYKWGIVYVSDYKFEIVYWLMEENLEVDVVMVVVFISVFLWFNGKVDVVQFVEQYFCGGGYVDVVGGCLDVNLI